ncbi:MULTISPECIES: hypothetical protein [Mammaliicoccus]|uniref:hypothetical protein n=1 Tax=Mammaliicoccus TaxID=2803850 RepID=UPI001C4EAABF|nr:MULTISPECIES: hypothetical protein [Mammaliicoccus]MBW0764004.1 hypothetical protein [Mammaliicoccus fleurettii]MEB7806039.1 hypothetical protein [Mammaliicoccus fleurettii]
MNIISNNRISKRYRVKSENRYINKWKQQSEWMDFFEILGKYVQSKKLINLYISYIDETLPAIFLAKGIIENHFENEKFLNKLGTLKTGDKVALLVDEKNRIWRKADILDVYDSEYNIEFNPYVKLHVILGKNNSYENHIPYKDWNTKIRVNPSYKSTAGTKIQINDYISEYLLNKYGLEYINNLKMNNQNIVNFVGVNIEKTILEYMNIFKFKENNCTFTFKDIIYLKRMAESYSNTQIIKSRTDNSEIYDNDISIFLGDNSSLNFAEYKTNKNIYLSNRKKNNLQYQEIFLDNYMNDSYSHDSEKINNEIKEILNNNKIEIPRGVEIYGY